MPSHLAPAGLLQHGASLCARQRLQTGLGWGQPENRTSVCAPAKFHSSGLVVQRLSTPSLASSQLPQAAGVAGGPVLCGRVSLGWFCLRAGSLRLHQQQGGSAQVIWPRFRPSERDAEPERLKAARVQACCFCKVTAAWLWMVRTNQLAAFCTAWTQSHTALDHPGEADIYFSSPIPGNGG